VRVVLKGIHKVKRRLAKGDTARLACSGLDGQRAADSMRVSVEITAN
jgi:hypothetical protein